MKSFFFALCLLVSLFVLPNALLGQSVQVGAGSGSPEVSQEEMRPPLGGRPRGLFTLTPVGGPVASIRDYDFLTGALGRFTWPSLETAQGVYDFSAIDNFLTALEAIDQKLSLVVFASSVPDYVLNAPGAQTYTHFTFGLTVVPWDSFALARWDAFCEALSNHMVPDASQGGSLVRLADHPTLLAISTNLVGLSGFRVIPNAQTMLPGYDRNTFTTGTLASMHSIRDRFTNKFAYVSLWPMNDGNNNPSLGEHIRTTLLAEFDGVQNPKVGLFQENWAASKDLQTNMISGSPMPNGLGQPLIASLGQTYVMLQAVQGWNCPFSNPNQTANATPADGIQFAFDTYDCRYFELYACDIDDVNYWGDFRQWATVLAYTP